MRIDANNILLLLLVLWLNICTEPTVLPAIKSVPAVHKRKVYAYQAVGETIPTVKITFIGMNKRKLTIEEWIMFHILDGELLL